MSRQKSPQVMTQNIPTVEVVDDYPDFIISTPAGKFESNFQFKSYLAENGYQIIREIKDDE